MYTADLKDVFVFCFIAIAGASTSEDEDCNCTALTADHSHSNKDPSLVFSWVHSTNYIQGNEFISLTRY